MQLDNNQKDRDQVVILFQDMLEVVTRDIMMDEEQIFRLCICKSLCFHCIFFLPLLIMVESYFFLNSMIDSSHGGVGHEGMFPLEPEPHHQLFASEGAISFPIEPVTAAWTEKVCYY